MEVAMVTLNLTDEEWNTLCNLLDTQIEELRQEIHDSDRTNYKEMLRQNRETLLRIIHKLDHVAELQPL
jgi:hypothetical protein